MSVEQQAELSRAVERIGIIGGSGLGERLSMEGAREHHSQTPFAADPVSLVEGDIAGASVVFLQRHGPGHVVPPDAINARANIAALASAGCTQVISISAVGSLREDAPPETFVAVDQFIDRTSRSPKSFFGPGLVGHVPFAEPTCRRLRSTVCEALEAEGVVHRSWGTYVVMDGPQFSTKAESELHRKFGGTVIGMTAMPEAKLAREAQLCYSMIAIPTDYDCWHDGHAAVTADVVGATMARIAETAERVVVAIVEKAATHAGVCAEGCHQALETAVMTEPGSRSLEMLDRLEFVVPGIRQV